MNDVPVGFAPAETEAEDNWPAERVDIFYMMRKESENIFNYLIKTGEFVINQ